MKSKIELFEIYLMEELKMSGKMSRHVTDYYKQVVQDCYQQTNVNLLRLRTYKSYKKAKDSYKTGNKDFKKALDLYSQFFTNHTIMQWL